MQDTHPLQSESHELTGLSGKAAQEGVPMNTHSHDPRPCPHLSGPCCGPGLYACAGCRRSLVAAPASCCCTALAEDQLVARTTAACRACSFQWCTKVEVNLHRASYEDRVADRVA